MFHTNKRYTLEQIQKIDEESIYRHYFPKFILKIKINSPFRIDVHPSFVFYKYNHKILWKDFNGKKGGIISFVMELFNLDFNQTIQKIGKDFYGNNNDNNSYNNSNISNEQYDIKEQNKENRINSQNRNNEYKKLLYNGNRQTEYEEPKNNTTIDDGYRKRGININRVDEYSNENKKESSLIYIEKEFTKIDYDIWESWGIHKNILAKYDISSASEVLYDNKVIRTYNLGNPIYIYKSCFPGKFKAYRPFAYKPYKWIGSMNNSEILGLKQLNIKKNKILNLLVICKSLKDVMLLTELGYSSLCFGGESYYMNNFQYELLSNISNKIIYLGDLDYTGVKVANYYKKKYGIIPKFVDCKREKRRLDPTDFYLKYGKEKLKERLKIILN